MKYYQIQNTLNKVTKEELQPGNTSVIVMTKKEFSNQAKKQFPDLNTEELFKEHYVTKAEVSYDMLSGCFAIPDRKDPSDTDHIFYFLLNKNGLIFIDDEDFVTSILQSIHTSKKWKNPSMARFLYDFIDTMIKDDLRVLESYEMELEEMEERLNVKDTAFSSRKLNRIRSKVRYMMMHYDQLIDLVEELDENENGFFSEEELIYFPKLLRRIERLDSTISSIREYTLQVKDMAKEKIDLKQNSITTLLTVVTTVFMPLTLITGWYGMNFHHMPELSWPFAYPLLFVIFVVIVILMLYFFKKIKWL
ncbi:MAG: hypothetical protein IJK53_06180 [Erysipelotrichaceae bacterium]|nr:hypothetical protein [Erysipelotrichaceae bacterium]